MKNIPVSEWKHELYLSIGVVFLIPSEIQERCGVAFSSIEEDLGLMDIAWIEIADGTRYLLSRYQETSVHISEASAIPEARPEEVLFHSLIEALGLDPKFGKTMAELNEEDADTIFRKSGQVKSNSGWPAL